MSKDEADYVLENVRDDGYYCVRKELTTLTIETESFFISFKTNGTTKHCRVVKDERQFLIDTMKFDSLIELIEYYQSNPLLNATKLLHPCTMHTFEAVSNAEPSEVLACRVKYAYTPTKRDDELSFRKGDLITKIYRVPGSLWWRGDCNGQINKWFPWEFTEITFVPRTDFENPYAMMPTLPNPYDNSADTPLRSPTSRRQVGDLPDTQCDVGKVIDLKETPVKILTPAANTALVFRWDGIPDNSTPSISTAYDENTGCSTLSHMTSSHDVRNNNEISGPITLVQDLRDLLAYFKPTTFTEDSYINGKHYELVTFSELDMEKLVCRSLHDKRLYKYHERQMSRVYPKTNRFDSSNYNPVPFWNSGVQMCAMNYQTAGQSMQVERGLFLDNGGCGYVLQPKIFRDPKFNPFTQSPLSGSEGLNISLSIKAARHLPKVEGAPNNIVACPFVEVEIIGLECDNFKFRTGTVNENGLCPVWLRQSTDFDVFYSSLAKIHFRVMHEGTFGDEIVIAQSCLPVTSLKQGHRSVPLKNNYNEAIPLAALLVQILIINQEHAHAERMQKIPERDDLIEEESVTHPMFLPNYRPPRRTNNNSRRRNGNESTRRRRNIFRRANTSAN